MIPHDWYVEHRVEFVARTLETDDEQRFADHVARCDECAAEVRAIAQELSWLPMGVQPQQPRPGLERRIVQTLLGERRPPVWRRALAPLAVAASLFVAFGLYVPQKRQMNELERTLASTSSELMSLRDSLSIMHQAARVLQTSISMDGHDGGLLIFADDVSHRWNVVVHGLPQAPDGEQYQFWFILSDGMVRAATVSAEPGRPAFLTLGMPSAGGTVMGASLTMEPMTNTSQQPRGKALAKLML